MSNQYWTNEQRLIERIKEWSQSSFIGDDCARIADGLLVTTDSLVEGTHFILPLISPSDLGWKAVAVNLSDVAAMAGLPRYLLINITVPVDFSEKRFQELYLAMVDCARTYKTLIVGGDLTKGPSLSLTIAVLGEVHEHGCLFRSGAQPGDAVVVTGDFGASAAGLWLLQSQLSQRRTEETAERDVAISGSSDVGSCWSGSSGFNTERSVYTRGASKGRSERSDYVNHCLTKHVHPHPRFSEAWKLVRQTSGKGALMDSSDGLADALVQIGRASKIGMQIDLNLVPIHEETMQVAKEANTNPLDWALYGGEDYELIACVPEKLWSSWIQDNPFKRIGTVTQKQEIELLVGQRKGPQLDLSKSFQQISSDDASGRNN